MFFFVFAFSHVIYIKSYRLFIFVIVLVYLISYCKVISPRFHAPHRIFSLYFSVCYAAENLGSHPGQQGYVEPSEQSDVCDPIQRLSTPNKPYSDTCMHHNFLILRSYMIKWAIKVQQSDFHVLPNSDVKSCDITVVYNSNNGVATGDRFLCGHQQWHCKLGSECWPNCTTFWITLQLHVLSQNLSFVVWSHNSLTYFVLILEIDVHLFHTNKKFHYVYMASCSCHVYRSPLMKRQNIFTIHTQLPQYNYCGVI